jgi:hypothetical protein
MKHYSFSLGTYFLITFVCLSISLVPLFLTYSDVRFLFLLNAFLLSLSLFVVLRYPEKIIVFRKSTFVSQLLKYVPIIIFVLYLVLSLFNFSKELSLAFAILLVFFVPGFTIIKLLRFNVKDSIGKLVIYFCCSLPVSALLFTIVLTISPSARYIFLVSAYFFLILLPYLIDHWRKSQSGNDLTLNLNDDKLSLHIGEFMLFLSIILFFLSAILTIYPNYVFSDMSTIYGSAVLLNKAPATFQSPEVWFNYLWAATYVLSPQQPNIFIFGMTFLGIILLFAFYLMAREYLGDIDRRAPIISTLIFFIGAGFGWFFYVGEKFGFSLISGATDEYSLLNNASSASYWDVWSGQASWLWIWFRSITVGAILFFCLIYFLARTDLSKLKFILVSVLLIVSLGMIHITELVQYLVVVLGIILLFSNLRIRLRDGVIGLILGTFTLLVLNILTSQSQNLISNTDIIALVGFSLISLILLRFSGTFLKLQKPLRRIAPTILLFLIVIFLLIVIYWIQNASASFVFGNIEPVPLGLYPVLLGIAGFLGILSAIIVLRDFWDHKVAVFIVVALAVFLLGQIITYVNVNINYTGYNERRLVPFVYSALCVLATIFIIKVLPNVSFASLKKKTQLVARYIVIFSIVVLIIIGSLTSTFLVVLTQKYAANYGLSPERVSSLDFLLNQSYIPVMLTATDRSYFLTSYVPVEYKPYQREMFWDSTSPLISFEALSSLNSYSIVYLTTAGLNPDEQYLVENYPNSYLYSDLLQKLPIMYNNSEVTITEVPPLVPPTPNSDFVLVLPENQTIYDDYAYELLSLSRLNYTTTFFDDINSLRSARVIVAPTESIAKAVIDEKSQYNLPFSKLFVLNLNGYGILSNQTLNSSVSVTATTTMQQIGNVNLNWVDPTEFSVSSNVTNWGSALSGSDYSWTGGAYGTGSIGEAVISNSSETGIRVTVGIGNYGYWRIDLNVTNSSALEDADFVSFYLYGNSDNQNDRYCFTASEENSALHITYRFYVNWNGWKQIILPTRIPNGDWTFAGLSFVKSSTGDNDWSKTVSFEITPSAESPDNSGVFYMSNFTLETGIPIDLSVNYDPNKVANVQILDYNSTNFIPLYTYNSSNTSLSSLNYFLESGLNVSQILGYLANAYLEDNHIIHLSLILPPTSDESILLKLVPTYLPAYSDCVVASSSSVKLPANISLIPFALENGSLRNSTLSFYQTDENNIPFAEALSYKDFNMTYINIYPLIQYIEDQKPNYRDLLPMLAKLAQLKDLSLSESYQYNATEDQGNLMQNMVAFMPSSFNGNISVTGKSAILAADNITLIVGNSTFSSNSIARITSLDVSNVTIKSQALNLYQGSDFYANMNVTNAIITFAGSPTATILYNNGTLMQISRDLIAVKAQSMNLLIRQPTVSVEGNGTLNAFYALGNFQVPRSYDTKDFYGDDVSFKGNLKFVVDYSDIFTFVHNFVLTGNYYIGRPLEPYSDTAMWITILPYALIFLIAMFVISYFKPYKEKKPSTESLEPPYTRAVYTNSD